MMDFLFASQDASTASLANITAQMANEPKMLQRVREEQLKLRGKDLNKPLDHDVME